MKVVEVTRFTHWHGNEKSINRLKLLNKAMVADVHTINDAHLGIGFLQVTLLTVLQIQFWLLLFYQYMYEVCR